MDYLNVDFLNGQRFDFKNYGDNKYEIKWFDFESKRIAVCYFNKHDNVEFLDFEEINNQFKGTIFLNKGE